MAISANIPDMPAMQDFVGLGFTSGASKSVSAIFFDGYPQFERPEIIQLVFASALKENPFNPRKYTSAEAMAELIDSLKVEGIVKPLVIMKGDSAKSAYLLSGHRRIYAAKLSQFDLVPCQLNPNDLTEPEIRKQLILHNEKDVKPAPIDRARAFFDYMKSAGSNQSDVAREFSIEPNEVSKLFRLLDMPLDVQDLVNRGMIRESAAYHIAGANGGADNMRRIARAVLDEKLTVEQTKRMVARGKRSLPQSHSETPSSDKRGSTNRRFTVGGQKRVGVHVTSSRKYLNDNEIFEAMMEVARNELNVTIEMPMHHLNDAVENLPVVPSLTTDTTDMDGHDDRALLSALWDGEHQQVADIITEVFPNFTEDSDGDVLLSNDLALSLKKSLDIDLLKKLGLTQSDLSVMNACKWHKKARANTQEITLLEYVAYLGACRDHVASSSKQVFRTSEMNQYPLDTPGGDSTDVSFRKERLLKEYAAVFKKAEEIALGPILTIQNAQGLTQSLKQAATTVEGVITSKLELEGKGMVTGVRFESSFFSWLQNTKSEYRSEKDQENPARIDVAEFCEYLGYCYQTVIELTGGVGIIGRSDLVNNWILYSKVEPKSTQGKKIAKTYGTNAVLNEFETNIQVLNRSYNLGL